MIISISKMACLSQDNFILQVSKRNSVLEWALDFLFLTGISLDFLFLTGICLDFYKTTPNTIMLCD